MIKAAVTGLVLATTAPAVMAQDYMMSDLEARVAEHAANSALASYQWDDRGQAPIGYIKGMAVAWARIYQQWKLGSPPTRLMAMADTGQSMRDALSWYNRVFTARNMPNHADGVDTLRHLFVLLTGLGMRESSGKFCEGRDRSASNVISDTAEAGLFQMSWDAHGASAQIKNILASYANKDDGLAHIFHEGVHCSEADLKNYGDGLGRLFQETCKASPMCAILSAGVGLRVVHRHWGPINTRKAEVRQEANSLYIQIQNMVDNEQLVAQNE